MKLAHNLYLIGLGSNLGDRHTLLREARAHIAAKVGPILREAPVYETPPYGGTADQPFLNTALVSSSLLAPGAALDHLLSIETAMGRVRRERWGNRSIDLDLLLWIEPKAGRVASIFSDPALAVPHPALLERDFALVPAAAVAGDWVHPATHNTLRDEVTLRGYDLAPLSPL